MKGLLVIILILLSIRSSGQSKFLDSLKQRHIVSVPDVRRIEPDYRAFDQKGLLHASRFELKKHIGKTLKTTGIITHAEIVDSSVILNVGVDSAHTDFFIVIRPKDRINFDHPEQFYLLKKVEVIGKVETFGAKPAIYLSRENQIRVITISEYR